MLLKLVVQTDAFETFQSTNKICIKLYFYLFEGYFYLFKMKGKSLLPPKTFFIGMVNLNSLDLKIILGFHNVSCGVYLGKTAEFNLWLVLLYRLTNVETLDIASFENEMKPGIECTGKHIKNL